MVRLQSCPFNLAVDWLFPCALPHSFALPSPSFSRLSSHRPLSLPKPNDVWSQDFLKKKKREGDATSWRDLLPVKRRHHARKGQQKKSSRLAVGFQPTGVCQLSLNFLSKAPGELRQGVCLGGCLVPATERSPQRNDGRLHCCAARAARATHLLGPLIPKVCRAQLSTLHPCRKLAANLTLSPTSSSSPLSGQPRPPALGYGV